jgi:cell wall-associated NlpC family hydrolase
MYLILNKNSILFLVSFCLSFTVVCQENLVQDSLKVIKIAGDSLQSNPEDTIVKAKNPEKIDNIINYAKKFMGTPYRYAGMTPSGFDCSGFINYVMGNFGISLSRTSYNMAEYGKTVKLADLKAGDLMFFKGSNVHSTSIGHVGLVVEVNPGEIKFIHSANSGVHITTFNKSKYYVPRFIKATRLDYGVE